MPHVSENQLQNDRNAYYQHNPEQGKYIEMDSRMLQEFDLNSPTYFKSMESVKPDSRHVYRKIITNSEDIVLNEMCLHGHHTYRQLPGGKR